MELAEQRFVDGTAEQLQDLVLSSGDLDEFLGELAQHLANGLSHADGEVICAVTVARPKKPAATGAGSQKAFELEEQQVEAGDGPCIAAMSEARTVYVGDVTRESRWQEFSQAAADRGCGAVLAVPIDLDAEGLAALSFYAPHGSGFTDGEILTAENAARQVSRPLRLSLRIGRLRDARDDLASAMKSRTVIDMAIGVVMAQNRCPPDEAFTLLRKASNARNIKLREVAASIVAAIAGTTDLRSRFDL
ncbi:ANTAR domain-containing protein [Arthrobacter sp. NPDC056886]|uniref:GAF and ANTAR domain-containing protein n=1 Tax=Arthrobacter sp. NPDC056886 TaxID=3345960 RepID=UPI00366F06F5